MHKALVSIGNTSETVRYAALAPAEAKKDHTAAGGEADIVELVFLEEHPCDDQQDAREK